VPCDFVHLTQEDPFEPILRQLSEPPLSAAVAASQPARQGSYFRRQASLPFPSEAAPAGATSESQTAVVERLVPDYDWEQDAAMSGAVFDYHFGNVTDLASVVPGDQVNTSFSVFAACFVAHTPNTRLSRLHLHL